MKAAKKQTQDNSLPPSALTAQQKKTEQFDYYERGQPVTMVVNLRYDDDCKNGHNSFSITADIFEPGGSRNEPSIQHKSGRRLRLTSCGCQHDEILKHATKYAPFIKWHLTSSDGPMYYIENTKYWAEIATGARKAEQSPEKAAEYARSTAVWPDATLGQLLDKDAMLARLPALMADFKAAIESLGFTY